VKPLIEAKSLCSSTALARNRATARHNEDVDDKEVCDVSYSVLVPGNALTLSEGSEEPGENHDDVCDDGDEDVSSAEAGQEGEIEEEKGSCERPVDVAGPEYLAEDVLGGVGDVLVGFLDDVVCEGGAFSGCHGVVGESGEGGD
jgi:hypothetical protein